MSGDLFLVALERDEVMGYTVGELKKRRLRVDLKTVGHILNVAVRKDRQETGVGTLLMDEVEDRLRNMGADLVYLEVRESNTVAQAMYRKRSYQYVRTAEGYYGDEDGFIMMKSLRNQEKRPRRL